jgi:hypothetical protein
MAIATSPKFSVLTQASDIDAASQLFLRMLTDGGTVLSRNVGFQGGNETWELQWYRQQHFWAVVHAPYDGKSCYSFGTADPETSASKSLQIASEMSIPMDGINRKCGGLFLSDGRNTFLAHTGRVGGGRKGIGKGAFLEWFQVYSELEWPDGKKTPIVIVGNITDPGFLGSLATFVFAVERFKSQFKDKLDIDEQLEADATEAKEHGDFDPANPIENQRRILRSVNLRRGQPAFRQKLLAAYGGQCAMTDCDCVDALEAAHIQPYGGDATNHVENGLLLRSDLHTLFDLGKVAVDSTSMTVVVSSALRTSVYGKLHGGKLKLPSNPAHRPCAEALSQHLKTAKL